MLTDVILYGAAKKRFGGPFRLNIENASDAVRALCKRVKGFRQFMEAGHWRVIRGDRLKGLALDERMLRMPIGKVRELHLIPVAAGSGKGKGIGKVVAGVALTAASFFVGGPAASAFVNALSSGMFAVGVSVGLAGVASLIAPTPKVQSYGDRERQKPSALFNNTVQMTEPGSPIPIAYGRKVRVGSLVPSVGLTVEQLGTTTP